MIDSPACAEANPSEAVTLAIPAQRHFVAVGQVASFFAPWQRQRLPSVRGQLQQTAAISIVGSRHRAGSQDVAGAQVAAVAGVMRQQLRDRPVQLAKGTAADADRRDVLFAHARRMNRDLEPEIETALAAFAADDR